MNLLEEKRMKKKIMQWNLKRLHFSVIYAGQFGIYYHNEFFFKLIFSTFFYLLEIKKNNLLC